MLLNPLWLDPQNAKGINKKSFFSLLQTPDINRDPSYFLPPLESDSHTFSHPWCTWKQHFYLPKPAFVCEGTLCSKRARRTHFLCQIASRIPHSPSPSTLFLPLRPPTLTHRLDPFFPSSSFYGVGGRLCLPSRDTKHRFIPQAKRDPWEHSETRTSQEAEGPARTSFWQRMSAVFEPTQTDGQSGLSWRQEDARTNTLAIHGATDVCGKISFPCKI